MSTAGRERVRRLPRDERGFALPLALMGLVVISLLVTAMLLSGTTEAALSSAHQDATRGLYSVEGGLEAYIAQEAAAFVPGAGATVAFSPTGAQPLNVTVRHLATSIPASGTTEEVYEVSAVPQSGGRSLTAMVRRRTSPQTLPPLQLGELAGLNVGATTKIGGNAEIHKTASGKYGTCDKGPADTRVTMASDAKVTLQQNNRIENDTTRAQWTKREMVKALLGLDSLEQAMYRADIPFGPNAPQQFNDSKKTYSPRSGDEIVYDWGCPEVLLMNGQKCGTGARKDWMPVVVIDAGGRTIKINGDYGQGMLVILNGDVHMNGPYTYKGIIAVEGVVTLNGNIHVEGTVLAQGIVDETDSGEVLGNQDIYFNRCVLEEVARTFNNPPPNMPPPPPLPPLVTMSRTFAWSEVVR
jgi:hypothetical protein